MPFREGQIIANYILERQLGAGAFGEVWLARHGDLGVRRAMKIPTDPQYVKQLRAEGVIQFTLSHPNIVQTLDLNTQHSPPYFVMEYVEGVSLRQKLKGQGRLPLKEALGLLAQILEALAVAHSEGFLHRDLKPENILITPQGRVKLTDFGLGKVQAEVQRSLLLSGSLMSSEGKSISGTVEYMSPEQKDGAEADAADDLYAAGIIACELLTGQRPGALGVARMLQRSGVDGRCIAFVEKAIEPERAERFGSAVRMIQGLAELRDGDTPSSPPSPPSRAPASQAPAGRQIISLDLPGGLTMKFVRIPAGTFIMGSPANEEGRDDDETQHQVTISRPFYMAVTTVTQAQWKAVMETGAPAQAKGVWASIKATLTGSSGSDPSHFKGDNLPVENVSWNDAVEFCKRLASLTGKTVRLPTEAQWEYACRAGTTTPFHTGGTINTDQADYNGNYTYGGGKKGQYREKTTTVGSFPPNAWGLHDMHGNVWEWCSDWYGEYPPGAATDPTGPGTGTARVLRGGSWCYSPQSCRSANRSWHGPGYRIGYIGFRVCLDSE